MKTNLKTLLLKTDCFIENEYFDLYLDLLVTNLNTKKIKGYTNSHHCIPLTYFTTKYNKSRRKAEYDSKLFGNIKVNLKFSDHIKAHYYLALCMSEHYEYGAISALNYLIGNFKSNNPNYTIDFTLEDLQLDRYQELYELGSKLNAIKHTGIKQNRTVDWNTKISKSNLGKKKIHLGQIEKAVDANEIDSYINNGWQLGPKLFSEERKQQCREVIKKATAVARIKNVGENNPSKRPEVRKKLSAAKKGIKCTEEQKKKISQTKLAQKKAKIIIINNTSYYGVNEAMKKLHVNYYTLKKLMETEKDEKK